MKIVVALLIGMVSCAAQTQSPAAPTFDGGRAFADLTRMVEIGPRPAGSPAIARTRAYIRKELEAAGLTVEEQPFEARTPLGPVSMVNLRATLPGTARDRGRIIIGGHYDTKLEREFRFVGASDAGSSAAFLLEIALELERIALEDDYFVSRKLYPNVDFYSGLIYQAMGFPVDMFPVLFAIPRTAGWIAQWEEMLNDQDQKIARPRQIYVGPPTRSYVSRDKRK